jgi:multidrug efflux pump subunit AcrA (membrane-fusion protein)
MAFRPVIFALLPALLLAGCGAPTQAKRQTPERPVLIAEVHYTPRERNRVLPGVVKARIESDLAFRVPGKLAERFVDAGAVVRKGDPLARLDDGDLRLQVEQADADYSSAKGALDQQQAEERRIGTLKLQGWTSAADVDKIKAGAIRRGALSPGRSAR